MYRKHCSSPRPPSGRTTSPFPPPSSPTPHPVSKTPQRPSPYRASPSTTHKVHTSPFFCSSCVQSDAESVIRLQIATRIICKEQLQADFSISYATTTASLAAPPHCS